MCDRSRAQPKPKPAVIMSWASAVTGTAVQGIMSPLTFAIYVGGWHQARRCIAIHDYIYDSICAANFR
jgi:hypothetical protein